MVLVPEKIVVPSVKRVIGVVSGKGGVGKSTVAALLAQALASRGRSVGVLDADITGPSIPRLLGVNSFRAESDGEHIFPIESEDGIQVLSINLLNENEDDPVIWRGPLLAKALEQFWAQTSWNELDYLIVDFPPGTSDIVLTAFQTIPLTGVIIVATPQDYVSMIVTKSIKMAAMLSTPVLGLVENMRTMICPSCGEEISLFDDGSAGLGSGKQGETGAAAIPALPVLARLPWRRELAQSRTLRWMSLPEDTRKRASLLADAVEMAIASLSKD